MKKKKVAIEHISENEIWVGECKNQLCDENIVHIVSVGMVDEEIATTIKDIYHYFLQKTKGKLNVLVDVNKAGKPTPETRQIWKDLTEEKRTGKVAIFGLKPVARVLAGFVMGVSKNKNMRFFKTKEESLNWLKE